MFLGLAWESGCLPKHQQFEKFEVLLYLLTGIVRAHGVVAFFLTDNTCD